MATINLSAIPTPVFTGAQAVQNAATNKPPIGFITHDDLFNNATGNTIKPCSKISCMATCRHRSAKCRD